jgi:hypothetical protein
MNNEPVAWMEYIQGEEWEVWFVEPTNLPKGHTYKPLYTHPAKTLTDEDIAKVVHELNQKARTPDRWVTAMEVGAETIIQLRDELAILKKASEK